MSMFLSRHLVTRRSPRQKCRVGTSERGGGVRVGSSERGGGSGFRVKDSSLSELEQFSEVLVLTL